MQYDASSTMLSSNKMLSRKIIVLPTKGLKLTLLTTDAIADIFSSIFEEQAKQGFANYQPQGLDKRI